MGSCERIHVEEKQLAGAEPGGVLGESHSSLTRRFRIFNPSVMLHLLIEVFARGVQGGNDTHTYENETWQLYTHVNDQRETRMHAVLTDVDGTVAAQPLPDDFEVETGTKVIHGEVNLVYDTDNSDKVAYYVRCTWEPAVPGLCEDELKKLYGDCSLSVDEYDRRVGLGPTP